MGARVTSILNRLEQFQLEFTDVQLTGSAGLTFLIKAARHLDSF